MKLRGFALMVTLILLISFVTSIGQTTVRKDSWSNYKQLTVFTGTDVSAADTSEYLILPSDATQGIFYFKADTVTTSDTLKSIYVQDSPDGVNWVNSGISISNITTAGIYRYTTTLLGRYIRLIFNVGGSSIKIDFNCKLVLKE
jgi:hypothetical protein